MFKPICHILQQVVGVTENKQVVSNTLFKIYKQAHSAIRKQQKMRVRPSILLSVSYKLLGKVVVCLGKAKRVFMLTISPSSDDK